MQQKLQTGKYTAIIKQLNCHLAACLSIYTRETKWLCLTEAKVPLSHGRGDIKISYMLPSILRLTKSHNSTAVDAVEALISHLKARVGDDFSIKVVPPQKICLEPTDTAIAAWLQQIVKIALEEWKMITPLPIADCYCQTFNSTFAMQCIHARCCALLRLADQEQLFDVHNWGNISWLEEDGQLCLHHPDERRLLGKLIKVVDTREFPNINRSVNWEKIGLNLCHGFEHFWSSCRIWGEERTNYPSLTNARLGLLLGTQSVLKFVLESKLGIAALTHL